MYTEDELIKLEEEEHEITEEALIALLLILQSTQFSLEKELRSFYQEYGKDGIVTYQEARKWVSNKDHRKRIFALYTTQITTFQVELEELKLEFETMVKAVIAKETGFFESELSSEDLPLEWGIDKLSWKERLEEDVDLWIAYLINDWKRFLLQQKTIDEVLYELDKRFKSMEYVLTTLAITETSAVGSIARHAIFKELGITKYQYYTRADERTCETCGEMHGLVFPMSAYEPGVTASPMHPRCRCFEIPL